MRTRFFFSMRTRFFFFIFAGLVSTLFFSTASCATINGLSKEEKQDGFELLFDGKTLDGWDGNPKFWSVEKGAIVGHTTKENPTTHNTFLFWKKDILSDFELRLSWKIEGHNSGIQYRSSRLEDWIAAGYQADSDAENHYTGILYEERGRGILANRGQKVIRSADGKNKVVEQFAKSEDIMKKINSNGWNDYVITAQGNHLVQKINGVKTIDFTDNEITRRKLSGLLAFQLHAGQPMTVRFRSIRLKRFVTGKLEPLFDGKTLTGWKRHDNLPGHGLAGKWFVEKGMIVGMQDPPGKGGFLTTYRKYRDFEIELETRIDWPFDSGVFLRVGPAGKSHQVTLDYRPDGEIGGIYCPWTRGFVHNCPDGIKYFKKDKWNKIKISCIGEPARIRVWVNGTLVTDFQHTKETTAGIPPEGTICLQVHPGGKGFDKSRACFRNIFIRDLSKKKR